MQKKIPICFLGTPGFAEVCLRSLLSDEHFQVVAVVSQPDRPAGRKLELTPSAVKKLALEKGIPVFTPEKASRPEFLEVVRGWGAEVAVVVAYGQILSEAFLASFPHGAVNVHASLLPRWRGAAPIQRSLEAGDAETGVCLQKMVKELDAGDVLAERKLVVGAELNAIELHDRLASLATELLSLDLLSYCRGEAKAVPQNSAFVTYAKKLLKAESHLDWTLGAQALHNKVRAFVLGPGTFGLLEDKKIKILKTRLGSSDCGDVPPGSVIDIHSESIEVATGIGTLHLIEIQPESRPRMLVKQFIAGHALKKGDRFL